jgi:hypothetical protein
MVQRRAAQVLGALGPRAAESLSALTEALKAPRWTVREAAAQALGRVGAGLVSARLTLVECALHDSTALVRDAAAEALARCPEAVAESIADLRHGLGHVYAWVRCRAIRALGRFGAHAPLFLPPLIEALTDSHRKVRQASAEVLGTLGALALPAVPALLRRLYDGEMRVSQAAAAALGLIGKAAPAPLQQWLTRLAQPSRPPGEVLRVALDSPDLSEAVRPLFVQACRRRVRWHQRAPAPAQPEDDTAGLAWEAVCRAADEAVRATQGRTPHRTAEQASAAWEQEHVWLLACLYDLLRSVCVG